jgi:SAM-dependent methyltransferase
VIAVPPGLRQGARDVFDALPPPARRLVRLAARRPGPRPVPLERLDAELAVAAELFAGSEDRAREFLDGLALEPPPGPPDDPFSEEYREWTWSLYREIAGRPAYVLENEESPIDVSGALRRPFPYATGSPAVVGEDLEARGSVLRCLGGPAGVMPPARIVEYGPGWGNLTLDLVATGYEVTAVELDPRFCDLIARRYPAGGRLEVVRADMLSFRPESPFDAAVFFESFHHCADHMALLDRLRSVVQPEGRVLFAGEPVQEMPYPWGPRLDGLSVWSMRTYGWLELGFTPAYFRNALARTGWRGRRYRLARRHPKSDVVVASVIPRSGPRPVGAPSR